jgi:hypothetical protein
MKLNLQVAGQNGRAGRQVINGTTNLPNHVRITVLNQSNEIIWHHSVLAKQ